MATLNSIWRDLSLQVGFFTKETFGNVPASPGVYAWFYPLRITTEDIEIFFHEVSTVLNYDATRRGRPVANLETQLAWTRVQLEFGFELKKPNFELFRKTWQEAVTNVETFDFLRQCVMKASIFMPPLYIGKTINLHKRCQEHICGNDRDNDFHARYTTYAGQHKIPAKSIRDLLFVCIKTNEVRNVHLSSSNLEDLIEAVMKSLGRPVYSTR